MNTQIKNDEGVKSKNQKNLASFSEYCLSHPEQRFWQSLRNWSGERFILRAEALDLETGKFINIKDTFYD